MAVGWVDDTAAPEEPAVDEVGVSVLWGVTVVRSVEEGVRLVVSTVGCCRDVLTKEGEDTWVLLVVVVAGLIVDDVIGGDETVFDCVLGVVPFKVVLACCCEDVLTKVIGKAVL